MNTFVGHAGIGCLILCSLACGSTGSDTPASGGGGSAGTGGTSGAGGNATGGSATGGSATGGSSAGAGGTTPDSGAGGSMTMFTKCYNFDGDAGVEGWGVTYTSSAPTTTPIPMANVLASLNTTDGQPEPGSLQLDIPYATAGQYVGVGIPLVTMPLNLTGKVVTARVKIVSGLGDPVDLATNPGGGKIYVKTSMGYRYANGPFTNLGPVGAWTIVALDPSNAAVDMLNDAGTYDPTDVKELGLQIDTSGTSQSAQPAVVLIDSVCY